MTSRWSVSRAPGRHPAEHPAGAGHGPPAWPTSSWPWTSGSRTTIGTSARPSALTSVPRPSSPCPAWTPTWAPSSSPSWATYPAAVTPGVWPPRRPDPSRPRLRPPNRQPPPAQALQLAPAAPLLPGRPDRDDAARPVAGLLPEEAVRRAAAHHALLSLARRRVDVLWARLRDKRLFTPAPPVTQTA